MSDRELRHVEDKRWPRCQHRRRTALTRRQVLQAGSATAIAAIAANFVPREVHADVTGEVVHLTASGSRFAGVVRGLMPLFEKAYPNVLLNVATIPTNEFLNKVNVYMQSKSDAFDSVTQDYGQYPSLESFGAMIPLQDHMDADPAWFADYQSDVPEALQSLYRIPIAQSRRHALWPGPRRQLPDDLLSQGHLRQGRHSGAEDLAGRPGGSQGVAFARHQSVRLRRRHAAELLGRLSVLRCATLLRWHLGRP